MTEDQFHSDFMQGKIGGRQHYYLLNDDHTYRPCTLREWSDQFEIIMKDKHVGDDEINGYRISTVWLGIDHNHFGWFNGGAPLLFETMVFEGDISRDIYMNRYSTWDEAVIGHQKAIEWVLQGCKDDEDEDVS